MESEMFCRSGVGGGCIEDADDENLAFHLHSWGPVALISINN